MPLPANIFYKKKKKASTIIPPPGNVSDDDVSDSGGEEYIPSAETLLASNDSPESEESGRDNEYEDLDSPTHQLETLSIPLLTIFKTKLVKQTEKNICGLQLTTTLFIDLSLIYFTPFHQKCMIRHIILAVCSETILLL